VLLVWGCRDRLAVGVRAVLLVWGCRDRLAVGVRAALLVWGCRDRLAVGVRAAPPARVRPDRPIRLPTRARH
jgi:hypothetical protein